MLQFMLIRFWTSLSNHHWASAQFEADGQLVMPPHWPYLATLVVQPDDGALVAAGVAVHANSSERFVRLGVSASGPLHAHVLDHLAILAVSMTYLYRQHCFRNIMRRRTL